MSTFCGGNGNPTPMSTSDMTAPYSKATGLLPSPLPPLNDGGLVDDGYLDDHIRKLKSAGVIPPLPQLRDIKSSPSGPPDSQDPLATYTSAMKTLVDKIKQEYCFYESQYFSSIDVFLQSIADASSGTRGSESVQVKLETARVTNQRVNVFTQVVNAISKNNYQQTRGWDLEINQMNTRFGKNAKNLQEQAEILNKSTAVADLNNRMVSYTVEKNKANNNLLSLYTVLNASAIAMLIYISRS